MATSFFDRVKVAVTGTPGTGTVTLGAAAPGYQSFAAAGCSDGATVSYVIEDGPAWEIGHGTYAAAGTLARTTVVGSSAGGSPINATSAATVFLSVLAEDLAALAPSSGSGGVGDPPTLVQSAGLNSQSPNVAVTTTTLATAPVSGNLLICLFMSAEFVAVANGWTLVHKADYDIDNKTQSVGIMYRVAGASEPAAQTPFTFSQFGGAILSIYEVSGTAAIDKAGQFAYSNAPAAVPTPDGNGKIGLSIDLAASTNSLILGIAGGYNNAAVTMAAGVVPDYGYAGYIGNYAAAQAFHQIHTSDADFTTSYTQDNVRSGPAWLTALVLTPAVASSGGSGGNGTASLESLSDVSGASTATGGQVLTAVGNGTFNFETPATGGGGAGGGATAPWNFAPPHAADYPALAYDNTKTTYTLTDDAQTGMEFTTTFLTTDENHVVVGKAIPSPGTPWTYRARVRFATYQTNYTFGGIAIVSGSNPYGCYGYNSGSSGWTLAINQYGPGAVGYVHQVGAASYPGVGTTDVYLSVDYDGSDYLSFAWSLDGKLWLPVGRFHASDVCGGQPDHIGFIIDSGKGYSLVLGMTIPYVYESYNGVAQNGGGNFSQQYPSGG